jgi:RNA polymerase sigma-70 factor (ECF subfamily)
MKILSDMTFKEISESLGQPIGTVTWRYNEAVKKLRTILASTA